MRTTILTVLVAFGLLAGCGGGDDDSSSPEPPVQPSQPLVGTTWELQEIIDTDDEVTEPVAGAQPTLRFDKKGTFSGFTGCNSTGGKAVIKGPDQEATVKFSGVFSTEAACVDPTGSKIEELLQGAFSQTDTVRVPEDGSGMTLTTSKPVERGGTPLEFRFTARHKASP